MAKATFITIDSFLFSNGPECFLETAFRTAFLKSHRARAKIIVFTSRTAFLKFEPLKLTELLFRKSGDVC
jgi:hypothetical protein